MIDNPNKNINVKPAIIKNSNTNTYSVIDVNTGVTLDKTPYDSIISAKINFSSKMINLDKTSINEINTQIEDFNTNVLLNTVDILYNDETIRNAFNDNDNNIDKMLLSFGLQNDYTTNQVRTIWNYIYENNHSIIKNEEGTPISAIDLEETGEGIVVKQYDSNGIEIWNSEVVKPNDKGVYSAKDLINVINSVPIINDITQTIINNNTSQSSQISTENDTNNIIQNNMSQNAKSTVSQNNSNTDTYIQEMAAIFQEDLQNSIRGERYKVGDKWTGQKRSTTKELADIKDTTGAS